VYNENGEWNQVLSIANNIGPATNSRPTVVHDNMDNALIAWEYRFLTNGNIKYRTVTPGGTLSSVTTFPNPPGTPRQPTEPVLSHHDNWIDGEHLTLTWHTTADGIVSVYFRNGSWQTPFVVSPSGQYVHTHGTSALSAQPAKLAVFMGKVGTPYRMHTTTLPPSTPPPLAPVLLSPANEANEVPVPVTFTWDYVIGASTYRLQVDDNSDFSSPVVDVSGITANNHYASLETWTTYYWRVNATNPHGTSPWSEVWSFTTGDPQIPTCPFVYTWNGEEFVEDNNILPQSLEPENAGIDVLDVYRFMKPPVLRDGKYLLQIREDAEDYSLFDSFVLIAVDHPPAVAVAMLDDGRVVSYVKPFKLNRAQFRGNDVVRELLAFDSLTVSTAAGDLIDIGFKRLSANKGAQPGGWDPLVNPEAPRADEEEEGGAEAGGETEEPVTEAVGRPLVFTTGSRGSSVSQVQGAYFRHNPTLVYIPFHVSDTTNIQLGWRSAVKLDYVNLAINVPARVFTRQAALETAVHSVAGDVTPSLLDVDGMYAGLGQAESIDLTFSAQSPPPGLERTLFLLTSGRYEHLKRSPGSEVPKLASSPLHGELPTEFRLHQNYPNPFNPTTIMKYDLPVDGHVTLKVYDVLGRQVLTLVDGLKEAGYHQSVFDARGIASGTYFYRLSVGGFTAVKKVVLLR
jgi:hypothetical protein